jgi:DNA-binding response OmpR family regulator
MKFRKLFTEHSLQVISNLNEETAPETRELLIVTRDQRLLSAVSYIVTSHGWISRWASSVTMAKERLRSRPIPFVLYDGQTSAEDWSSAIGRLRWVPEEPYIILAAERVDERLWRRAISMEFYDVVARDLQEDHLLATLTFAWQRKTADRLMLAGVAAAIAHAAHSRKQAK